MPIKLKRNHTIHFGRAGEIALLSPETAARIRMTHRMFKHIKEDLLILMYAQC